jgi:ribosomal protein S27E
MERIKNIGKSKKLGRTLREQNAKRYGIENQALKGLESFYCRIDKFTIVELLFRDKRYHGLSAKSDQDMSNLSEGIAHAYSRAFENLVLDIPPSISYCNKQCIKDIIGKGPSSIVIRQIFNKAVCNLTTIDLGGLPINDPSAIADSKPSNDVYKIECQHCGEISNYFAKTLDMKTKCPVCGRRLSEPATPQIKHNRKIS